MGKILVKVKEKYLECEKPEGVSESILGSLILGVSKVDELPIKLDTVDCSGDCSPEMFFDKEGIEKIYQNAYDHNHCVIANERFSSEKLPNAGETEDGCHITYYAFDEESYEKLMTLFKKENRLFQYSV